MAKYQMKAELMADVRMGHFFIGRPGPHPVLRRKERPHGVDVAVIRRS